MELTKIFEFSAAHRLPDYKGQCNNLHGHTWKVEITIEGKPSPKNGMIFDFSILKAIVQEYVILRLDHTYLNYLIKNPTAENIAVWIWAALKQKIPIVREVCV